MHLVSGRKMTRLPTRPDVTRAEVEFVTFHGPQSEVFKRLVIKLPGNFITGRSRAAAQSLSWNKELRLRGTPGDQIGKTEIRRA
jgi:hypothetical protein